MYQHTVGMAALYYCLHTSVQPIMQITEIPITDYFFPNRSDSDYLTKKKISPLYEIGNKVRGRNNCGCVFLVSLCMLLHIYMAVAILMTSRNNYL